MYMDALGLVSSLWPFVDLPHHSSNTAVGALMSLD